MELTREALAQVKFRTRGQWYDALQVDQFIEELMAAADRQEEESRLLREEWMARLAQATEEAQGLRERLRALERETACLQGGGTCPHCGSPVKSSDVFCGACGGKL